MSRAMAAVDFEGGRRLFLIFDHTVGSARRPLFETEDEAWAWYQSGGVLPEQTHNALVSELPAVMTTDLNYEGDERWQFETRASFQSRWLTGPQNEQEAIDERSDPIGPYGY